jgi:hypothetical protein
MELERDPRRPFPWTWDELLEHGLNDSDYPRDLREGMPTAVAFLRSELGEIDSAAGSEPDDRLWHVHFNSAPWTRYWLIWLASSLRALRPLPSYGDLLRRLRSRWCFAEAVEVVEVAEVCQKAGLFVTLDPLVCVKGMAKKPDILVSHAESRDDLFIEITTLHDPQALREATRVMMQVAPEMLKPNLRMAGRCERLPQPEDLDALLAVIQQVAEMAARDGTLRATHVPGLVEVAYAPELQIAELGEWASRRGLRPTGFEWPDIETKEVSRVGKRIWDKAGQLPCEKPGAIVIKNPRLRGAEPVGRDELGDRSVVRERLLDFPHVVCCVFSGGNIAVGPPLMDGVVRPSWSSVASRKPFALWRCDYEFIWNDAFALTKPRSIMRRIYRELLERHRSWQRNESQPGSSRQTVD